MKEAFSHTFYGTTTVSKKGQVVIPAEARQTMQLEENEKLLVFGMGTDMVILAKVSNLEKMMHFTEERLEMMRQAMKKAAE